MKKLIVAIALIGSCLGAHAQSWFKVANENDTVTTATTLTYSFGAASGTTNAGVVCSATTRNCFAPSKQLLAGSSLPVISGVASVSDPAPGLLKELDVQEVATSFTVTDKNSTASSIITIPALTPPPAPVVAIIPASVCLITPSGVAQPVLSITVSSTSLVGGKSIINTTGKAYGTYASLLDSSGNSIYIYICQVPKGAAIVTNPALSGN